MKKILPFVLIALFGINSAAFAKTYKTPNAKSPGAPNPGVTAPGVVQGYMPPPEPPAQNPHPPVTEKDKRRVAFAEKVAKGLLGVKQEGGVLDPKLNLGNLAVRLHIDEACFQDPVCLSGNQDLQKYLKSSAYAYGSPHGDFRHAHLIPWSLENFDRKAGPQTMTEAASKIAPGYSPNKQNAPERGGLLGAIEYNTPRSSQQNDELIVHVYGQSASGMWHHIDVILSEDASGNLRFERFFILQFPSVGTASHDMVC